MKYKATKYEMEKYEMPKYNIASYRSFRTNPQATFHMWIKRSWTGNLDVDGNIDKEFIQRCKVGNIKNNLSSISVRYSINTYIDKEAKKQMVYLLLKQLFNQKHIGENSILNHIYEFYDITSLVCKHSLKEIQLLYKNLNIIYWGDKILDEALWTLMDKQEDHWFKLKKLINYHSPLLKNYPRFYRDDLYWFHYDICMSYNNYGGSIIFRQPWIIENRLHWLQIPNRGYNNILNDLSLSRKDIKEIIQLNKIPHRSKLQKQNKQALINALMKL